MAKEYIEDENFLAKYNGVDMSHKQAVEYFKKHVAGEAFPCIRCGETVQTDTAIYYVTRANGVRYWYILRSCKKCLKEAKAVRSERLGEYRRLITDRDKREGHFTCEKAKQCEHGTYLTGRCKKVNYQPTKNCPFFNDIELYEYESLAIIE